MGGAPRRRRGVAGWIALLIGWAGIVIFLLVLLLIFLISHAHLRTDALGQPRAAIHGHDR